MQHISLHGHFLHNIANVLQSNHHVPRIFTFKINHLLHKSHVTSHYLRRSHWVAKATGYEFLDLTGQVRSVSAVISYLWLTVYNKTFEINVIDTMNSNLRNIRQMQQLLHLE
ncbi:hypothetical protein M758_UG313900 [Ceratodon purpureus]|nr:hypothetical protein M758_UG313900 [Ceratodon purpureus]